MAQRRIDSFANSSRCFFLIRGKCIIENSNVSQWLLLVSFIQNHSAITQLFYVTMSSSLKPIVHHLLYSEMLRERNSSLNWKVTNVFALRAGTLPALAQRPLSPNIFLRHCLYSGGSSSAGPALVENSSCKGHLYSTGALWLTQCLATALEPGWRAVHYTPPRLLSARWVPCGRGCRPVGLTVKAQCL